MKEFPDDDLAEEGVAMPVAQLKKVVLDPGCKKPVWLKEWLRQNLIMKDKSLYIIECEGDAQIV